MRKWISLCLVHMAEAAHFTKNVDAFVERPEQIKIMGEHGYRFLLQNYQVDTTYQRIVGHLNIK